MKYVKIALDIATIVLSIATIVLSILSCKQRREEDLKEIQ